MLHVDLARTACAQASGVDGPGTCRTTSHAQFSLYTRTSTAPLGIIEYVSYTFEDTPVLPQSLTHLQGTPTKLESLQVSQIKDGTLLQ